MESGGQSSFGVMVFEICIVGRHNHQRLGDTSGPAPAILDWYGHCVRVSVNKAGGSGGMLPQENFLKLGTLRSLLRPCLGQKSY